MPSLEKSFGQEVLPEAYARQHLATLQTRTVRLEANVNVQMLSLARFLGGGVWQMALACQLLAMCPIPIASAAWHVIAKIRLLEKFDGKRV